MKKSIVIRTRAEKEGYAIESCKILQDYLNEGYQVTYATKLDMHVEYILEKDVDFGELYKARMELLKSIEEWNTFSFENEYDNERCKRAERAERLILKFLNENNKVVNENDRIN